MLQEGLAKSANKITSYHEDEFIQDVHDVFMLLSRDLTISAEIRCSEVSEKGEELGC